MKKIKLNSQEVEWLITELDIMLNEEIPRSQFSINTMRSLLAKLKEENENN